MKIQIRNCYRHALIVGILSLAIIGLTTDSLALLDYLNFFKGSGPGAGLGPAASIEADSDSLGEELVYSEPYNGNGKVFIRVPESGEQLIDSPHYISGGSDSVFGASLLKIGNIPSSSSALEEFVIGAPMANGGKGAAWIVDMNLAQSNPGTVSVGNQALWKFQPSSSNKANFGADAVKIKIGNDYLIAISAPREDKVYIYLQSTLPNLHATLEGPNNSRFGWALAAGDVNYELNSSTRHADLIVGAPLDDTKEIEGGGVYIYDGHELLTNPQQVTYFTALYPLDIVSGEGFGRDLSAVQSNGSDGLEVVVGSPFWSNSANQPGRVLIYSYDGGGWDHANRHEELGLGDQSFFGASVAAVGIPEDPQGAMSGVFVGAPGEIQKIANAGTVRMYYPNNAAGFPLVHFEEPGESGDKRGETVSAVGDLDGEDYPDAVAAAPYSDNTFGKLHMYGVTEDLYTAVAYQKQIPMFPGCVDPDQNKYPGNPLKTPTAWLTEVPKAGAKFEITGTDFPTNDPHATIVIGQRLPWYDIMVDPPYPWGYKNMAYNAGTYLEGHPMFFECPLIIDVLSQVIVIHDVELETDAQGNLTPFPVFGPNFRIPAGNEGLTFTMTIVLAEENHVGQAPHFANAMANLEFGLGY